MHHIVTKFNTKQTVTNTNVNLQSQTPISKGENGLIIMVPRIESKEIGL